MLLFFQFGFVSGQPNWKLVASEDNIQVFNKTVKGSKIKALRTTFEIKAGLTQVAALLMDVEAAKLWMCNTRSCSLIKRVSASELYCHTEVDLPWPLSNRDFVSHMKMFQDPVSKTVMIDVRSVYGMVAEKHGVVRVNQAEGNWILRPMEKGRVKVDYTLLVDPGGVIPAYVVNIFAVQVPVLSIKKMRHILPKYDNTVHTQFFISEP